MNSATQEKTRVSPMGLCNVLALFVDRELESARHQAALDALWGKWCMCSKCNMQIASAEPTLWDGDSFRHASCIENGDAVSWGEVTFPGCKSSVAELLSQQKARKEEKDEKERKALKVA